MGAVGAKHGRDTVRVGAIRMCSLLSNYNGTGGTHGATPVFGTGGTHGAGCPIAGFPRLGVTGMPANRAKSAGEDGSAPAADN